MLKEVIHLSSCQPGTFIDVGNFRVTFVGVTDQSGGIFRWCWDIELIATTGITALSHWDVQTCPALGLDQLERLIVTDVTRAPVTLLDTTNPVVMAQWVDFNNGFNDGFPVYGMKTDVGFTQERLSTTGETWRFCYDFDENEVPLEPVIGFAAAKNGGGPEADIGFGVCTPVCGGPSVTPGRRGIRF